MTGVFDEFWVLCCVVVELFILGVDCVIVFAVVELSAIVVVVPCEDVVGDEVVGDIVWGVVLVGIVTIVVVNGDVMLGVVADVVV